MPGTHQVTNQVAALLDYDPLMADPALSAALRAHGLATDDSLRVLSRRAGSAEAIEWARLANENPPILRAFDATGHRIDEVEFHPAWHHLMQTAVRAGLQAAPWAAPAGHNAHLHRAAGFYLWSQVEHGHICPITMTYACIPALRHSPALTEIYEPGLRSLHYDFGLRDPADKRGLLAGMSMTEKQGGSDIRATTTTAVPIDQAGGYRVTGHKWFTSAPMNDVFLTLARTPEGIGCFLLPRVLPGGELNEIRLQRLKDKLGNRSNASAELEYNGATGFLIGEPGRGIHTIIEMVTMTRLDCVLGSASVMRAALTQATHHAAHRQAFGTRLADQPAMIAVLADIALESWAATTSGLRLAAAVDAREQDLLRLAIPVSKFWFCKRAPTVVAEALECLGGNGYVEESVLPRLFRESPLNGLWEGSGNITALDALRALHKSEASADALLAELASVTGSNARFDRARSTLGDLMAAIRRSPAEGATNARRLSALAARLFAATQMIKLAPPEVSDLYCETRFGDISDRVLGELPEGFDLPAVVSSVTPQ